MMNNYILLNYTSMHEISDSGLITKIWGPHMWVALHSIAYCYPSKPTEEDKKKYKDFFELLGHVLPCIFCKESYKGFIKEGSTELNDDVFKDRESVTKWLYYVHEAVNKKLGVNYNVSYEEVSARYESYRANCIANDNQPLKPGCDATINKKTVSYNVENTKDCPIIPIKIAKHFIKYARMRGIGEEELSLINQLSVNYDKNSDIWHNRNTECAEIAKNMNLKGIKWIEHEGKWKGYPTIEETRLILRLSSNISVEKLVEIIRKLPDCHCEYKKIYYINK